MADEAVAAPIEEVPVDPSAAPEVVAADPEPEAPAPEVQRIYVVVKPIDTDSLRLEPGDNITEETLPAAVIANLLHIEAIVNPTEMRHNLSAPQAGAILNDPEAKTHLDYLNRVGADARAARLEAKKAAETPPVPEPAAEPAAEPEAAPPVPDPSPVPAPAKAAKDTPDPALSPDAQRKAALDALMKDI